MKKEPVHMGDRDPFNMARCLQILRMNLRLSLLAFKKGNITQIVERHTRMLMVDQAAGSYRALMILSKKYPSWQRAPKAHT